MSYVDEKEIPESTRVVGSVCPPGFIPIHRKDWERVNCEVQKLKAELATLRGALSVSQDPERSAIDAVVKSAAATFGYHSQALLGSSRVEKIINVRTAIVAILREQGLSFSAIGRAFERDHSSIMHLHRRHENLSSRDAQYRTVLVKLFDACNSPKPN